MLVRRRRNREKRDAARAAYSPGGGSSSVTSKASCVEVSKRSASTCGRGIVRRCALEVNICGNSITTLATPLLSAEAPTSIQPYTAAGGFRRSRAQCTRIGRPCSDWRDVGGSPPVELWEDTMRQSTVGIHRGSNAPRGPLEISHEVTYPCTWSDGGMRGLLGPDLHGTDQRS